VLLFFVFFALFCKTLHCSIAIRVVYPAASVRNVGLLIVCSTIDLLSPEQNSHVQVTSISPNLLQA